MLYSEQHVCLSLLLALVTEELSFVNHVKSHSLTLGANCNQH